MISAISNKTIIRRDSQNPNLVPEHIHPVLARVYAARKLMSSQDLDYSLQQLLSSDGLTGLKAAAEILEKAIRHDRRILIVGDFDADGATSCALAIRALKMMGCQKVNYLVPNRFEYGYGLTPEIVSIALGFEPDLIVTVDNGISSIAGVKAAKEQGIEVLITDHHLPGQELPEADVIVNPNLMNDPFPSKNLAGVGVIFYVMLALRARLRKSGWFTKTGLTEPNLAQLLDLVALGTVADVVPLDHNNRILVAQGLARIRSGRCCPGIHALIQVAGRQAERLAAADLGFAVGPRLNAAGRLDDMSRGIECLLSDDHERAMSIASELDSLNQERRAIESEMHEDVLSNLKLLGLDDANNLPVGLCLFNDQWHQGVIGILASRIKERFHRPVIVFAADGEHEIKGSARSISGLHIRDVLDAIAARSPGLLIKFGGHAMAAGMTLKRSDLEKFRIAFEEEVRSKLSDEDLQDVVYSDGELSSDEISLDVAEALRSGGPWGQGFPEPVFDGCFEIIDKRIVGEKHLKFLLQVPGSDKRIDAIAFNADINIIDHASEQLQIVYKLDVNEFRGQRHAQLIVEQMNIIQ